MPVIQVKRGLVANKPASAAAGEPVWTTDAQNLYFGTGAAVVPLKIDAANVTNLPAGAVSSVFGRTGAVAAAANDYNFNQLAGTASTAQIPNLDASKITTGQLAAAQLPSVIDGGTF